MKLDIKHLAPYLPYGLKYQYWLSEKDNTIYEMQPSDLTSVVNYDSHKPIFRPLYDFTFDELELLGNRYDIQVTESGGVLFRDIDGEEDIMKFNYDDVLKMIEWHFDVFCLIDEGLAIDKNTLQNDK